MKKTIYGLLMTFALAGCGSGEAPAPVSVAPSPAPVNAAPTRTAIVFIGDSITASWRELPADYVNAGQSGQWSELMFNRFDADVMARNPAVLEILAGTNDVRLFVDPPLQYIAAMADRAAASGACVIIGTVPPDSVWGVNDAIDDVTGNQSILAFNVKLKDLAAAHGYFLADYHSVLMLPDGSIDQSLYTDGIHPNTDGRLKMLALVEPLVAKCKLRLGLSS